MNTSWLSLISMGCLVSACSVRVHDNDCDEDFCDSAPNVQGNVWYPSGTPGSAYPSTSPSTQQPNPPAALDSDCFRDGLCNTGEICSASGLCQKKVLDCPLTDACLADPPGYIPPATWAGIDPSFSGTLAVQVEQGTAGGGATTRSPGAGGSPSRSIPGTVALRLQVDLDFYSDHLYGTGELHDPTTGTTDRILITGSRNGSALWGQLIPRDGERTFDATFEATLISGSEIRGLAEFASATGTKHRTLELFRTSPCGCDTATCTQDADCGAGSICENHSCQAATCAATCECPSGSECQLGRCTTRENPIAPCTTDCDCDLNGGSRCRNGLCTPASALSGGSGGMSSATTTTHSGGSLSNTSTGHASSAGGAGGTGGATTSLATNGGAGPAMPTSGGCAGGVH